jgi:hypothetical protein
MRAAVPRGIQTSGTSENILGPRGSRLWHEPRSNSVAPNIWHSYRSARRCRTSISCDRHVDASLRRRRRADPDGDTLTAVLASDVSHIRQSTEEYSPAAA